MLLIEKTSWFSFVGSLHVNRNDDRTPNVTATYIQPRRRESYFYAAYAIQLLREEKGRSFSLCGFYLVGFPFCSHYCGVCKDGWFLYVQNVCVWICEYCCLYPIKASSPSTILSQATSLNKHSKRKNIYLAKLHLHISCVGTPAKVSEAIFLYTSWAFAQF